MPESRREESGASPEVSLVIPVYNEEDNVPLLHAEIHGVLDPRGLAYEIVWIDDGSSDASGAELDRLAVGDPRSRVVRLTRNSGQSAALAAGFWRARAPIVVTLDADLQNDPADIPALLEALAGCDVVSGVRQNRRDSWVRLASSRIANAVRNWATNERITDVGCSLKAYRAEYLRHLPMFTGMHRFLPTLVRWNGARVRELPVSHRPRLHGRAKYGIGNRLFHALADLMAVRWMRSRWIDPRRIEVPKR